MCTFSVVLQLMVPLMELADKKLVSLALQQRFCTVSQFLTSIGAARGYESTPA